MTAGGNAGYADANGARIDDASEAVAAPLTKGPRGGGRERDQIVRHVYASERHNWWRKWAFARTTRRG